MKTAAVIVGAGASARMGQTISKQLIKICGKEVIVHTLLAFQQSKSINQIIVVCRSDDKEIIAELIKQYGITKVTAITHGGSTRQQSVQNGVKLIKGSVDYVAVHDGARPLITPQLIDSVTADTAAYGAAAPGVAVKDTIKVVDSEGNICDTPDRSKLVAIQTPQVFEKNMYLNAVKAATKNGKDFTDDCQLIETMENQKVHVTMGDYNNIKITTPDDIGVAESILSHKSDCEYS